MLTEQHTLKKESNCGNTNISFYLGMSGGQSYNLYINVAHVFNASVH
jgi:hypothetical protein